MTITIFAVEMKGKQKMSKWVVREWIKDDCGDWTSSFDTFDTKEEAANHLLLAGRIQIHINGRTLGYNVSYEVYEQQ